MELSSNLICLLHENMYINVTYSGILAQIIWNPSNILWHVNIRMENKGIDEDEQNDMTQEFHESKQMSFYHYAKQIFLCSCWLLFTVSLFVM